MDRFTKAINQFAESIQGIQCSESTAQALLYHECINCGYTPSTVCTEFQTGPGMLDRADIALFSDSYDGRFSWYHNADGDIDNSNHKEKNIRGIIEIKGGYTASKTVLGRLDLWLAGFLETRSASNPLADIDKLKMWKSRYRNLELAAFVCVDFPEARETQNYDAAKSIASLCDADGVTFFYVDSSNGTVISSLRS